MISARHANFLCEASEKDVANFLKIIVEPAVKAAATSGKHTAIVYLDCLELHQSLDLQITPFHKLAMHKLVELGYSARITLYGETYVPVGLTDDSGEGPAHRNYGIMIEW